ncbi:hypothetical protein CSV63_09485 [Sporosarcina sp. P34]|nr:hypothetical protein CSV63_09485 [Sporosarcina sp. P34]
MVCARTFTQIAFVVEDSGVSAASFGELLNLDIPPKIKFWARALTQVTYKGEATEADVVFTAFKTPTIEVELIQPGESPNVWKDHLEKHGEGVHHISLELDNLQERLSDCQEKGYDVIQQGEYWNGHS